MALSLFWTHDYNDNMRPLLTPNKKQIFDIVFNQ
jgi:hypothetical protein